LTRQIFEKKALLWRTIQLWLPQPAAIKFSSWLSAGLEKQTNRKEL